ncbi:MAG: BrnT family toxin [Chloroflexota bacterium]|nr:MAG: BrnT family toxin [Chloroflexota bacterium]
MKFEWDDNKRRINLRKHGLDFTNAYRAFNEDAFVITDDREDYNESRYILLGFMREHIVVIAFTVRGDVIRVISMRKANKREQKSYLQRQFGVDQ